jgi:ketosteroid isomerase-like protein
VTDDRRPDAIAHAILTTLAGCTRRRDLAGVLELFVDDAAIFGSDAGEFARGRDDVRDFLTTIFAEPVTYGWTWDHPVAGRHGEVVWFVALGQAVLEGDSAPPPVPYRLSGVLLQAGGSWRFALFNGAQPVPEWHTGTCGAGRGSMAAREPESA